MNIEELKKELKRYNDLLEKLNIENAGDAYGSDEWASGMVQIISNIKDIKRKLNQLKNDKYQESDLVSKPEITPPTPTPKPTVNPEPTKFTIQKHDFDPETGICLICGYHKTVEATKHTKTDTSEFPLPISEPIPKPTPMPEPTVTPAPSVKPTPGPTVIPTHREEHDFDPETNICLTCGFHKTEEKHTPDPTFYTCTDGDYHFPISENLNSPLENKTKEQKSRRL